MSLLLALYTGLLSAILPCPLTTNLLAVAFLARQADTRGTVVRRALAYAAGGLVACTLLGAAAVWGVISIPSASLILQRYRYGVLGVAMLAAGVVLSGLVKLPFRLSFVRTTSPQTDAPRGIAGAFWLGAIFAVSFCPNTAAMFFGNILAATSESVTPLLPPLLYGLGAAAPVAAMGMLVALGTHRAAAMLNVVQTVERYVRLATGVLFLAAGVVFLILQIRQSL